MAPHMLSMRHFGCGSARLCRADPRNRGDEIKVRKNRASRPRVPNFISVVGTHASMQSFDDLEQSWKVVGRRVQINSRDALHIRYAPCRAIDPQAMDNQVLASGHAVRFQRCVLRFSDANNSCRV
jgi:hypothetical protein